LSKFLSVNLFSVGGTFICSYYLAKQLFLLQVIKGRTIYQIPKLHLICI
jgi:hypothetical protein